MVNVKEINTVITEALLQALPDEAMKLGLANVREIKE